MVLVRVKEYSRHKPFDHQNLYRQYGYNQQHLACIMEMRTGKTPANIWYVQDMTPDPEECYPCLIVSPQAVIHTWMKELALEGEKFVVIHGKSFDKRIQLTIEEAFAGKGRTWVLVNYESLLRTPGLTLLPWFFVGLDESTIIKNPQSKISKLCTGAENFMDTKHRCVMSGLPSPEGELDLFQQFYFLDRQFMGCRTYWEYRNRYFDLHDSGWKPKAFKPCPVCENLPGKRFTCKSCGFKGKIPWQAKKLIREYVQKRSFIMTRQETGMGEVKVREIRTCKMAPDQRKVYDQAENEFVAMVELDGEKAFMETNHVITQRIWMARATGGCDALGNWKWNAKAKELLYLLKGELANQPVVVWFRFDAEIKAIAEILRKEGISHQTLTGEDNLTAKIKKQEWFEKSKVPGRVFLVQEQKVAEYGVDMSASSTAIYYSYVYSGQTIAQTEDRILKLTKKEPLLYIYLVCEDTIDEDIVKAIRDKVSDARLLLRVRKNFLERTKFKKPKTIRRAV